MNEFIKYILWELKNSLGLVFLAGIVSTVVLAAAYFGHKRKFNGQKKFPWIKEMLYLMLVGYLAAVLYVTLLRSSGRHMNYNLHLFRAWREAWNNYSVKNLANVLLNVALFMPLGVFLPLIWKKFRKWHVSILAGFSFSLVIELIQLVSSRGVCDVDDLFCNTMGTAIGYLLIMTVLAIFVEKRLKSTLAYGSLSLASIIALCSIFLIYNTQEYGNLPYAAAYTIDTSGTHWSLDCELPAVPGEIAVYQNQPRTKQDCDVFADEFKKIIGTEYTTISYYQEAAYYMDQAGDENGAHFLYVDYLDQSYEYTASFHDDAEWIDTERENIVQALSEFPVLLPSYAEFVAEGDGWHSFVVNQYVDGDILVDGTLRVRYAEDKSIREIQNELLSYTYYDNVEIITPEEAYNRLCAGKFYDEGFFEYKSPTNVSVLSCTLEYEIDTKGFYQPVYYFDVISNDESYEDSIMIPAMK